MLDEITRQAGALNEDQQRDVLKYIQSIQDVRTYPRVKTRLEVDVLIDDKVIQSDSRNMSASGVFINTSVKAEPGTSATVVFMVPGQKTPFKLKGKVVRTEEGGVAIWFSEMTNYAQKALGKLLLA